MKGLCSIDPNVIRHSVGIVLEMSKKPQNIHLIEHLSELIWAILRHSVTESTSHYAALCLYNISPRAFDEKIERQLFLGETKVKFAKGFMREKWIKRAKKTEIPTKVEEPPVAQPKPIPNPQPIRAQRYNCHLAVKNLQRDKFSE